MVLPLLLLCWACGCATAPRNGGLYARARAAAVEILVEGRLQGSGWFADADGLVVTAAHVVPRGARSVQVLWGRVGPLAADVVARDPGHDLALLQVKGGRGPYPILRVVATDPVPGDPVYFYGAALFNHAVMIRGAVARTSSAYHYFGDRRMPMRAYYVTAPSPPGTSGGPWLDARGFVAGSQSGFLTHKGAGAGIAIVAPPDAIARLVRTRRSVATAGAGCGVEELWSQPKGFIRRFPRGVEGLVTVPLEKGGPAEKAGLTRESLILAVEGKPARYRGDFYRAIYGKKPGDLLLLRVMDPDRRKERKVGLVLGRLEP
jgi:serine protease Do